MHSGHLMYPMQSLIASQRQVCISTARWPSHVTLVASTPFSEGKRGSTRSLVPEACIYRCSLVEAAMLFNRQVPPSRPTNRKCALSGVFRGHQRFITCKPRKKRPFTKTLEVAGDACTDAYVLHFYPILLIGDQFPNGKSARADGSDTFDVKCNARREGGSWSCENGVCASPHGVCSEKGSAIRHIGPLVEGIRSFHRRVQDWSGISFLDFFS